MWSTPLELQLALDLALVLVLVLVLVLARPLQQLQQSPLLLSPPSTDRPRSVTADRICSLGSALPLDIATRVDFARRQLILQSPFCN
jgi:hypothetical protein